MATIVRMPALSDTMTEGVLVAWLKKVGDSVKVGETLAEIETDKAVMEFDSFFNGTLLYAVEAGNSIQVDSIIAVIGAPGEDWQAAVNAGTNAAPAAPVAAPVATPEPPKAVIEAVIAPLASVQPVVTTTHSNDSDDRTKASPLAKSIAREEGVDITQVKGSGDDGRIVKRDIEAFLQNRPAAGAVVANTPANAPAPAAVNAPAPDGDYIDTPVTQMRKTIASRLAASKFTAPEFYLTMEINMDKCMTVRETLNQISPVKLSFNDFVIKATSMALRKHPSINSAWLGDKIRTYNYVNMGVAVAVEDGLLVPVIRHADTKSLSEIASAVKSAAEKAKDRKLQPADMQGNTFTISNLGMFGIDEFTAIINPPDSCILAVGRISEKAVRTADGVGFINVMKVTLTCDHRTVDGASGAKFLQTLRDMLEDPMRMLV